MSTAKRTFKNIFYLGSSEVLSRFVGIIATAYTTRILGPENFGKLTFAAAIVSYFAVFANPGIDIFGIREIAADKDRANHYVDHIFSLKLFLAALFWGAVLGAAYFLNAPSDVKYLVILFGLGLFANAVFIEWVFQAIEKMQFIALVKAVNAVLYIGLLLLFFKEPGQMLRLPVFMLAGTLASAAVLLALYRRMYVFSWKASAAQWLHILRHAVPIGLTAILSVIITNAGIIILGFTNPQAEVGIYSAAQKIDIAITGLAAIYFAAVFPVISSQYNSSREDFDKVVSYTGRWILLLGVPMSLGTTMLAGPIVRLFFGDKFSAAAAALQIFSWHTLLMMINAHYSRILWVARHQKDVFKIVIIQTLFVVAASAALIPGMGAIGAAASLFLGELASLLLYSRKTRAIVATNFTRGLWKILACSCAMGMFLKVSMGMSPLAAQIGGGAAVYAALLYVSGGFSEEELRLIKNHYRGLKK